MNKLLPLVFICLISCVNAQSPAEEYILQDINPFPTFMLLLDETSGTFAADLSGNGNNGTYINATINQPPLLSESTPSNKSALLQNDNSLIQVPLTDNLNLPGLDGILGTQDDLQRSFTIIMWVKLNDLANPANGLDCSVTLPGLDSIVGTSDDIFIVQRCGGLWRKGNGASAAAVYMGDSTEIGPDLVPFTSDDTNQIFLNQFKYEMVLFDPFFSTGLPTGTTIVSHQFSLGVVEPFDMTEKHMLMFSYDSSNDQSTIMVDVFGPIINNNTVNFTQTGDFWRIGNVDTSNPPLAGLNGSIDNIVVWYDYAVPINKYVFTYFRSITGEPFKRGDANQDGSINITDLTVIFSAPHQCSEAADANNDNVVNIADVVYLGSYLFGGSGPPPAAPFPGCGFETTEDTLTCLENVVCD